MKWDEALPEEETSCFQQWMEEVTILQQIRIPRRITLFGRGSGSWSLHTFTDASKIAYGAVVFLRTEFNKSVFIQLLAAKARVAPVRAMEENGKSMTIPRLELMGCLVGARLCTTVKKSLDLTGVSEHYWTDSSTALAWIQRNKAWGCFVGNRTVEINKLTKGEDWKHVRGSMNPADLPSRGCTP